MGVVPANFSSCIDLFVIWTSSLRSGGNKRVAIVLGSHFWSAKSRIVSRRRPANARYRLQRSIAASGSSAKNLKRPATYRCSGLVWASCSARTALWCQSSPNHGASKARLRWFLRYQWICTNCVLQCVERLPKHALVVFVCRKLRSATRFAGLDLRRQMTRTIAQATASAIAQGRTLDWATGAGTLSHAPPWSDAVGLDSTKRIAAMQLRGQVFWMSSVPAIHNLPRTEPARAGCPHLELRLWRERVGFRHRVRESTMHSAEGSSSPQANRSRWTKTSVRVPP